MRFFVVFFCTVLFSPPSTLHQISQIQVLLYSHAHHSGGSITPRSVSACVPEGVLHYQLHSLVQLALSGGMHPISPPFTFLS